MGCPLNTKLIKRENIMEHTGKYILFFLIFTQGCQKQSGQHLAKEKYRLACAQLTGQRSEQDYRRALGYVDQAIAAHYTVEYEALKATLLLKLGDAEESTIHFQHALASTSDAAVAAEVKNNYACALAQQGHGQDALEIWRQLVRDAHYMTPEVAWVNIGKWHVDHRYMKKAHYCFLKAACLEPMYVDAHFYGALASYACGERSSARNQITTLLALEPEHAGARRLLKALGDHGQVMHI